MAEPWFKKYNDSWLANPGQNDAGDYGVSTEAIHGASLIVGGVHHLDQSENGGNHNWYFDVLNEKGERIHSAKVTRQLENGGTAVIALDKPDDEPGNFPVWPGEVVSAWVSEIDGGKAVVCDKVKGWQTAHPDEPPGNTRFHHSILSTWIFRQVTPLPPTSPTVDVQDAIAHIEKAVVELAQAVRALKNG